MALDLDKKAEDLDQDELQEVAENNEEEMGPGLKAVVELLRSDEPDPGAVAAILMDPMFNAEYVSIMAYLNQTAGNGFVNDVNASCDDMQATREANAGASSTGDDAAAQPATVTQEATDQTDATPMVPAPGKVADEEELPPPEQIADAAEQVADRN
jgi:hypothetical protein